MYQYHKGFIIREGTEGVPSDLLRELYVSVGWAGSQMPDWHNEKFEIALKTSAWAYTVWDKERLIALVRVVSDKVMIATVQDSIVHPDYQGKGIGSRLVELCLQKLPHGKWFSHTTSNNYEFYRRLGFSFIPEELEATLSYNGYKKAREEGNR